MNTKTYRGIIFATAGGIGWGLSGVCSQYLFMYYNLDPSWLTVIRMIFSGIILLCISIPKNKNSVIGILKNKKDALQLIYFSIAGLLLCQYAFLAAIKHSNSGTATVLQSLNVIIMAIFISFKMKVLPKTKQVFSIFLALTGVYLIATNGNIHTMTLSYLGLFWGIMAALGVVFYTFLSQNIIKKWGNLVVTGWGMLVGGLALNFFVNAWKLPSNLDIKAFIVILVIIFIGTAGAFAFFLEGVRYVGPIKATLIACLEPVTATIISAIWLHTQFNSIDIIGFCLILATVFLSVR